MKFNKKFRLGTLSKM